MNYPQIMSPLPFASKSGGHVPQLLRERRPWPCPCLDQRDLSTEHDKMTGNHAAYTVCVERDLAVHQTQTQMADQGHCDPKTNMVEWMAVLLKPRKRKMIRSLGPIRTRLRIGLRSI